MRTDKHYWHRVYLDLAIRYEVAHGRRRLELSEALTLAFHIYRRST